MGSNCDSVANSLPWAACKVLTWIITSLWSLFFPVLALTLTMCYHAKAAESFLMVFGFGAIGQMPVRRRSAARVWLWRLATLLVYVPQSYMSFMILRWTICWMLDLFGSQFALSNIFFLLIVSVMRAVIVFLALVFVVVLLIYLLWNTVDIFIVRNQKHTQEEDAVTATTTEVSPLLRHSRALDLEEPTPVARIVNRRNSTDSSTSVLVINNHTPHLQDMHRLPETGQYPPTHGHAESPPFSGIMLSVASDSPPDLNPFGISWMLGAWNPVSIMLWVRACSQASDDSDLDQVSDDGGDLDSSSLSMPDLIADEGSNEEDLSDGNDEHSLPRNTPEA